MSSHLAWPILKMELYTTVGLSWNEKKTHIDDGHKTS